MMIILCYALHFSPEQVQPGYPSVEFECEIVNARSADHAAQRMIDRSPETSAQWGCVWHETPAPNLAIVHYEHDQKKCRAR